MAYKGNDFDAKIEAIIRFISRSIIPVIVGRRSIRIAILIVAALGCRTTGTSATETRSPVSPGGCAPVAQGGTSSRQAAELREIVLRLVGPALPVQEAAAQGAAFERYEKDFRTFAERHWRADGPDWKAANYYDRAKIFYVWWARTGNDTFLKRANEIAIDYRRSYIEANGFRPSAHWSQMAGLALHCLVAGDVLSGEAVGRAADLFSLPDNIAALADLKGEMDNRIQARTLEALLLAWQIGAPSLGIPDRQPDGTDWGIPGGNDWANLLRVALGRILASQSPDGAYRFRQIQCGYNLPFMVGLLNDALIQYHEQFEADPGILPAVKRSLDYLWSRNWDAKAQAFVYLEGPCEDNEDNNTGPAPDLNNLILSGFGWLYRQTGDTTYRDRGDAVLAGAVKGAWLDGSKQFNQAYTTSYKYAAFRKQGDGKR
ncbi:hypothetical protein [Microvirga sp. G4-2]|uniref:hypothetical protein n=1 Tax=Microvirga sp. G4-2 TaxID=3434467 RepID=UPI0040440A0F